MSRQTKAKPGQSRGNGLSPADAAKVELPPLILIELDPAITSGFIYDRYDLLVHGRIVSNVPIDEVVLKLRGVTVGRVQHGQADHAGMAQDGQGGIEYVFHITVPLPRSQAHGVHSCVVIASTQSGAIHEQIFDISVDPANPLPVSVIAGPISAPRAFAHMRPPVLLYVERAALDDTGQLLVHGWAVSFTPTVAVQVFLDEECVGAARLGGQRDDVAGAFPAYPNAQASGFTLSTQIDRPFESIAALRVQAISLSGFLNEAALCVERAQGLSKGSPAEAAEPVDGIVATLPQQAGPAPERDTPEPPRDPRREIRFFCDEMDLDAQGHLRVVGWAVCPVGIASVTVYLDGEEIGQTELGLPRSDVGEEYRHIPMARQSGFRLIKLLGDLTAGEHTIRLLVRNGVDDTREDVRTIQVGTAALTPLFVASPAHFRLEIDSPSVVAGTVIDAITGRLTIEGWALARSGIAGIEVVLDDQRLGEAHYGLARQDVAAAFPDWSDSLRSGFAFHCPPRSLSNGHHVVRLSVRARNGEVLEHQFSIRVTKPDDFEDGISIRHRIGQVEVDVSDDVLEGLNHRPEFHLILRQGAVFEPAHLLATLGSLRSQAYRHWHLAIVTDGADTGAAIRSLLTDAAAELVDRIDVIGPSDEAAFDGPLGSPDETTSPHLVGCLSAGDRLGCDALLQIALASGLHREAELLYADEVRISPVSHEREPFFKPDFSPDLLLSTNYIGRPWFASAALVKRSGLTARRLVAHGEFDAVLRCAERGVAIHHVPRLLCERGDQPIDDAATEAAALHRAAKRRGLAAMVEPGAAPGAWRFQRTQKATGLVSIIIPTCGARGVIETCLRTLRERTAYRNIELICVDNIPEENRSLKTWLRRNADKVVPMPDAFNWSQFNNHGAEAASGEYLLFLNDDIEVTQPEWLDAMLEHAQRPEVAVVGPQLLFPDNKVQHAGMFLGTGGIARHAFRFAAANEPGYFGLALTQRNVIAVTGACMLMRRSVYRALGGFEEAHQIINNDLDFCLRAHQAGKLIVYTPYATLVHHEAASRDRLKDVFDLAHFEARWRTLFAAGDPYFNPLLSRQSEDYRPDDEPTETVFAPRPLFRHADIKRILVVKVDHIGDFVTAIPAIQRLKQIFPAASIHVLTSAAAQSFGGIVDCIDEFIEFQFFHAISGQGAKLISEEAYQALRDRLATYRFDLAVDMRKHLDTRDVLRYTPARFLAGYDYMGQFPFLDISLEWEGDRNLARKRSHVSDDLINLVEAIGAAGTPDRAKSGPVQPAAPPDSLPEDALALFNRPVVAVHPGVGNAMRQWPAEHFAALIDLLVQKNSVNVLLIGGPEEAELAEQVLGGVINRHAVVSLVGRTPLRQLFDLLRACVLYVGNNSGPKHIAATLGVPTVGIHSGVVDAIEWGPIGRRAVAVRRNMTCSPCYLERPEDCQRNLACLRGLEPTVVHEASKIFLATPVEQRIVVPLAEKPVERQPIIVALPSNGTLDVTPRKNGKHAPAVRAAKPRRLGRKPAAVVSVH